MPGVGSQACPKKPKGTYQLERIARRKARVRMEEAIKQEVRTRDSHRCRFPGCTFQRANVQLHVAHLEDKGMGGDPAFNRTQRQKLICLCFQHHEGPFSLHSGDVRIEPDTAAGTDGPCAFYVSDEQRKWKFIGVN